jgi:Amidohydrolase family
MLLSLVLMAAAQLPSFDTAIVGATVIDVTHTSGAHDLPAATVLIAGERIRAVVPARTPLPLGAHVIDARGAYLIPGLIDGYGALRSQAYAAAYLYEGVTTVVIPVAPADALIDGETHWITPAQGPAIVTSAPLSGYNASGDVSHTHPWLEHKARDPRLSATQLTQLVHAAAQRGARIIAVGQDVWPQQLAVIVRAAHARGLAVSAQPALTDYPQALRAGVDVFVRNDKYTLAASSATAFAAYADDPVGPGGRPAGQQVCDGGAAVTQAVGRFAQQLRAQHAALMPILSMEDSADDLRGANPWKLRAAHFFTPADLDDPVDPVSGARPYLTQHAERAARIRACAYRKQAVDRQLHAAGVRYLAGTAAPSYGVIPGGGLHEELRLLQQLGLTPREALAAATYALASSLRLDDRGEIAVGRRADLVLLDADPRADTAALAQIRTVLVGGRSIDREALYRSATPH